MLAARRTMEMPVEIRPVASRPPVEGADGTKERVVTAEGRIRLLVAHKHALLRQGLRLLLAAQRGVEVLDEARDGQEAIEKALRLRPDIVLLDAALPATGAIEPTRTITRRLEACRVVVMTAVAAEEEVATILQSGAAGCILKDGDGSELAQAVQAVYRGGSYLSPAISRLVVKEYVRLARGRGERRPANALSSREREVLQLVAEGRSNQQIADTLCVSIKTVEAHKTRIMHKLGARNRSDLIRHALRLGMVDLDPAAVAGDE